MGMSSRDRVLTALNHEEPDRVPLFIGTSGATSVLGPGYPALKAHLGIRGGAEQRWLSRPLQYVWMDDEVMERLGSDGRPAVPGPAASSLRRDVSPDCIVDDWGCAWSRGPGSGYFEIREPPLRNATIDDLAGYPWPDLSPASRFEGLADRCRAIQQAGYASVLLAGATLFEQACFMRGIGDLLLDLAADPEFFSALLGEIRKRMVPYLEDLFSRVGDAVDIVVTGDDLGTQESTMMSPAQYRAMVKGGQAEMLAAIHRHTRAKVYYHSCGNIYRLIGDLVEIGVDLLNPVQVSAPGLADTARLKREFGSRLSFCGAIDTRHVLPHGTAAEVRAEVRRRITDLGPGGGYVAAAVHCIQPDVPPANVVAMCNEVARAGRYPLRP
jgi:uroporphyrinogen decarboxylase